MQSVPYDSLGTLVFCYQTYVLLMGSPITGVQNAGGVGKKLFFSQSTENLCPSAVMVWLAEWGAVSSTMFDCPAFVYNTDGSP